MSKRKQTERAAALPWKRVLLTDEDMSRVSEFGGGFYGFEELDGKLYDEFVQRGQLPETHDEGEAIGEDGGVQEPQPKKRKKTKKTKQSNKNRQKESKPTDEVAVEASEETGGGKKQRRQKARQPVKEAAEAPEETGGEAEDEEDDGQGEGEVMLADAPAPATLSSEWDNLGIPPVLLTRLSQLGRHLPHQLLGFASPTPIQKLSIPAGLLYRKDVVGAAETGSGKTLAFGIPLVAQLQGEAPAHLPALILTPTRELAVQISAHLLSLARGTTLRVCSLVGGMSRQKQDRLLSYKPQIIVATPGRLWEKVEEGNTYLRHLNELKFLVIDEADRMVEAGHYEELNYLLDRINAPREGGKPRQTFIFSATLTMSPTYWKKPHKESPTTAIEKLMSKVELQVIDLTPPEKVARALEETKIACLPTDKDLYTYYLLKTLPGRSIIFLNSISSARRLTKLLSYFGLPVYPLHGQMQQRQRLKNLDRFKATETVTTDVAARGLDIPLVQHVLHYHVPPTSQLYIHRSGRTARALAQGTSVTLIGPDENKTWSQLLYKLGKPDIAQYQVDPSVLNQLRQQIAIAQKLESLEHRDTLSSAQKNWLQQTAEDMEMSLSDDEKEMVRKPTSTNKATKREIAVLKSQLSHLLAGRKPPSISKKGKRRK